ncbi:pseudouridine synthase [Lojkania enalia]|uniref:tRNA pseudouridine(55) synthase n=1 Tax=Lojkania enalia TaxID=147567 RepID=A0A9P4JXE9_9PLEO|nr:pseudouridine synthase [Didymosphaeria enalia]
MTAVVPLARTIMVSSPKESHRVLEGIFAINKPQWQSSAGVLRNLQNYFQDSRLFAPWLTSTRRSMILSSSKEKHIRNLKVKLGHGGTLDPLATGVLIVGVGKGTKCLQRFLECTKSYECVVLFGAATDSYDAVGKVVSRAPYQHVTKEIVEKALEGFKGKIMQKPSVFSALKVDGKKMYEYAREGGDIPEVQARPVEVHELELVEWLEPGAHEYTWPKEEAEGIEKVGAEKLMGVRKTREGVEDGEEVRGVKRSREEQEEMDNLITDAGSYPKKIKTADEPEMTGALPVEDAQQTIESSEKPLEQLAEAPADSGSNLQPPAARLRMTVTSGFYVRSLCHDLGLAVNSLGLMSSLIRTRQGDYSLGHNVLEYSDLVKSPEEWETKVQKYLEEFMEKEGWEAEEVEDEEEWQANRKERLEDRKENDRYTSYRGGRNEGGRWRSKKGSKRNFYSKDMRGRND